MIELTLKNSQLVSKKEEVQRISKIALEFIEHSSEQVREKAFEILGKVWDSFDNFVLPLLSDLNQQKMQKILKYC